MKYIQTLIICLILASAANAQDTIPPTITTNNPQDTIFLMIGDSYALEPLIMADSISPDSALRATLTVGGTYFGAFGTGPTFQCGLGFYTCIYTIYDEAGNKASYTRYIFVEGDVEAPIMEFPYGDTIWVLKDSDFNSDTITLRLSDNYFSSRKLMVTVTEDNVDVTKVGTYHVEYEIRDSCGNMSVKRLIVIVGSGAGTRAAIQGMDAVLFPNPTSGYSFLEVTSLKQDVVAAEILNIHGQVVQSLGSWNTSEGAKSFDIGQLNSGLYFLEIKSSGQLLRKRITLMK